MGIESLSLRTSVDYKHVCIRAYWLSSSSLCYNVVRKTVGTTITVAALKASWSMLSPDPYLSYFAKPATVIKGVFGASSSSFDGGISDVRLHRL